MKEFEIMFVGNNGQMYRGYFYGKDESEAKADAVAHGIGIGAIKCVVYKEEYRGYGHI